jgi:hypothetical protein
MLPRTMAFKRTLPDMVYRQAVLMFGEHGTAEPISLIGSYCLLLGDPKRVQRAGAGDGRPTAAIPDLSSAQACFEDLARPPKRNRKPRIAGLGN